MADIVQLEEKGNLLYPKTHTSAIDGFDETVVKKTGNEDIAGVKNFKDGIQVNNREIVNKTYFKEITNADRTGNAASFGNLYGNIYRVGNLVKLQLRINLISNNNDGQMIYKLPKGYKMIDQHAENFYITPCSCIMWNTVSRSKLWGFVEWNKGDSGLRFFTGDVNTGNSYVEATWITNDPYPIDDKFV
ncbi:hypothetical protein ABID30_002713 [Enterococcus rotai]|uniref:Uncharacterized protein n=2 Tax=Enterococcus TaxID=1350 RepID=R2SZH5_9ENTE|nr:MULTISPECIES: hypothetical protein [Enterococcus]ALS37255.1 hypothetical protein ATZ35_08815 [Enterococcus rotai]EOH93414.1 hypothetical protein UAW_02662 [Enterococcus haemoperoxidus ATCC BAA-382]EOT61368.1 hypothetical protein I583_00346 [Enterococcus haemoperoxidus ATCC BAA-382]OJG54549.1 hypothetical protein RV06_GL002892 [Enterococcus haemoperoxidus]